MTFPFQPQEICFSTFAYHCCEVLIFLISSGGLQGVWSSQWGSLLHLEQRPPLSSLGHLSVSGPASSVSSDGDVEALSSGSWHHPVCAICRYLDCGGHGSRLDDAIQSPRQQVACFPAALHDTQTSWHWGLAAHRPEGVLHSCFLSVNDAFAQVGNIWDNSG